jgi:hypothetical protein
MEKTPERRRRLDVLTQAERSQRISANGGDGRGGAVWWYQSLDLVSSDFPLSPVRAASRDVHIVRYRPA